MLNRTSTRIVLGLALTVAAACGSSSPSPPEGTPDAPVTPPQPDAPVGGGSATVKLTDHGGALGKILTDGDGKTLYYFAKDLPTSGGKAATSGCNAACTAGWPPFHAATITAGPGLNAADFAEITRADNTKQTTYKGWPLYHYAGDAQAGDANGDGTGHNWFVLRDPAYGVMVMSNATFKTYLVDPKGMTLYVLKDDSAGALKCTDGCLTGWPTFDTSSTVVPTSVDPSLTEFTRSDNQAKQATWKAHPLYYFAGDTAPGDTKGSTAPNWSVVDPTTL
jgi:predicted lipoprotein with Yx(FWY)xxD motif